MGNVDIIFKCFNVLIVLCLVIFCFKIGFVFCIVLIKVLIDCLLGKLIKWLVVI